MESKNKSDLLLSAYELTLCKFCISRTLIIYNDLLEKEGQLDSTIDYIESQIYRLTKLHNKLYKIALSLADTD